MALGGAPAQKSQPSRKGKKSWRKNVDIDDVQTGLELLREEERLTGSILQKQKDSDLFQIDVKGDENVRKSLPRFSKSQLTSSKILAQRSAVPAVFSRSNAETKPKKTSLTPSQKARLIRMTHRPTRGPLNSIIESTSSTSYDLSTAVQKSGTYDPWSSIGHEEKELGIEHIRKAPIKPPHHPHLRDAIALPALPVPHAGTSYNPPAAAHRALLLEAHAVEVRRIAEEERLEAIRKVAEHAREVARDEAGPGAPGMVVDVPGKDDGEERIVESTESVVKKQPLRKTRQQRQKAARLLAERRELVERKMRKRLLAMPASSRSHASTQLARAAERAAARARSALLLRVEGLSGQRIGRHRVPREEDALHASVQLGEELSESFRGVRGVSASVWRERAENMMRRGLMEPRKAVLPKRRKRKEIEYEKHAWKRFV